jgi:hypothetical protein
LKHLEVIAKPSGFAGNAGIPPAFFQNLPAVTPAVPGLLQLPLWV